MRRPTTSSVLFRAPHYAGALFCLSLSLLFSSCGEKEDKTPNWNKEAENATTPAEPPAPGPTPTPAPAPEPNPAPPEANPTPGEETSGPPAHLRFLSYNVKNYLTMSRYVAGERTDRKKPEKEINALVKIVVAAKPDVLGLCEIGTLEDLAELQKHLADAGLILEHSEHAGGADDTRHLALLSRLPIVATDSQGAQGSLTYKSVDANNNPSEFAMQRGILDVTVQAGDKQVRFLGVHLKSKREIREGHQDLMRRNEAYLLRKHADHILESAPGTLLCVYGDFNETRRESPVRSIQGPSKSDRYLEPLSHKDSRGEVWTHYWDYQHVYSRFDYVLASRPLRSLFVQKLSRIIDDPEWSVASDHRPLLSVFKLEVKP